MDLNIQTIMQVYKEEIGKLQNENLILKAQLLQLQKNMEEMEKEDVISGDDK